MLLSTIRFSKQYYLCLYVCITTDENYDIRSLKNGNNGVFGQAEVLAHVVRQNQRSKQFQRNQIFEDVKSQFAIREKSEKLNEINAINSLNFIKIASFEDRKSQKNKRRNSKLGNTEKIIISEKNRTNTRCNIILFFLFCILSRIN